MKLSIDYRDAYLLADIAIDDSWNWEQFYDAIKTRTLEPAPGLSAARRKLFKRFLFEASDDMNRRPLEELQQIAAWVELETALVRMSNSIVGAATRLADQAADEGGAS